MGSVKTPTSSKAIAKNYLVFLILSNHMLQENVLLSQELEYHKP